MTGQLTTTVASLRARIVEQPWQMLGGAFLLGAWVGFDPPHAPRNSWARAAFAMIGSIAIRLLREGALLQFAGRVLPSEHDPGAMRSRHEPGRTDTRVTGR
jgi:hypothetical protein